MGRFQIILQQEMGNRYLLFEDSRRALPELRGQPLREGATDAFRGRTWRVRFERDVDPAEQPPRFLLVPTTGT